MFGRKIDALRKKIKCYGRDESIVAQYYREMERVDEFACPLCLKLTKRVGDKFTCVHCMVKIREMADGSLFVDHVEDLQGEARAEVFGDITDI